MGKVADLMIDTVCRTGVDWVHWINHITFRGVRLNHAFLLNFDSAHASAIRQRLETQCLWVLIRHLWQAQQVRMRLSSDVSLLFQHYRWVTLSPYDSQQTGDLLQVSRNNPKLACLNHLDMPVGMLSKPRCVCHMYLTCWMICWASQHCGHFCLPYLACLMSCSARQQCVSSRLVILGMLNGLLSEPTMWLFALAILCMPLSLNESILWPFTLAILAW